MRIVAALGGNALLRRGEPLTAENQRSNIRIAAQALKPIAEKHDLVVTHGNGPQVGLLALQGAAYKPEEVYPLDVLGSETQGMIGYMIEQEMGNLLPFERPIATLLTQIEVARDDPAFQHPTKPIGPVYDEAEAKHLAEERGWVVAPDGDKFRRVVPSPRPKHIFEKRVIEILLAAGAVVICAGGGGIPTMYLEDGTLTGVEAVIDKDHASGLLAREIRADIYLMLTDVDAVWVGWGQPDAKAIKRANPAALRELDFAGGSMGPKVVAACEFAEQSGRTAGIGSLRDAPGMVAGEAGTLVSNSFEGIEYYADKTLDT